jgi:hypothetical protein
MDIPINWYKVSFTDKSQMFPVPLDRTDVTNLHIIIRHRLLGQMMAVTQRHQTLFGVRLESPLYN